MAAMINIRLLVITLEVIIYSTEVLPPTCYHLPQSGTRLCANTDGLMVPPADLGGLTWPCWHNLSAAPGAGSCMIPYVDTAPVYQHCLVATGQHEGVLAGLGG